jgi:hypothetical protein
MTTVDLATPRIPAVMTASEGDLGDLPQPPAARICLGTAAARPPVLTRRAATSLRREMEESPRRPFAGAATSFLLPLAGAVLLLILRAPACPTRGCGWKRRGRAGLS